uniref:Capsid protein n=1 Tax=Hop mosaic virus TaxID=142843 RepID=Q8V975_9VIRU|nr:coat protein [Hop mosaic virus]
MSGSTEAGKLAPEAQKPQYGGEETKLKEKVGAGESSTVSVDDYAAGLKDLEAVREEMLEARLEKLREFMRRRRSAVQITNSGLETGRPALTLTADMRSDPANPYCKPSLDSLLRIPPKPVSNNMATAEDIMKIYTNLEGLGVPTEHIQRVIIQAVIYCKDASSSVYLDPRGSFEWPGGAIAADSVLAIMKKDAETLRRVCRLYAPVTWSYMLVHNQPPSDWAAMGFQFEDRFAAFDCFDYVENAAAVQPLEGIVRRPTPREKLAHNTHKDMALRKANRNQHFGNMDVEVTGGRSGPEIIRDYSKSNR